MSISDSAEEIDFMEPEIIDTTQEPASSRAASCSAYARTLFVWAKDGQIRCFSPDEIRSGEDAWKAKGWRHTATLDPARWIEAMANGNTDSSDMLDELQMGPNAEVSQNRGAKGVASE